MSASDSDRKHTTVRETFRPSLKRDTEAFLNAPETDIPRRRYTKKLLRRIRRRQNGTDKLLRGLLIAGLALLAALALAVLAVLCVPTLRTWFTDTFLEAPVEDARVETANPPCSVSSDYRRTVSELRADGSYYEEYSDRFGRYAFMFIQTAKGRMKNWTNGTMTAETVEIHGRTTYLFTAQDGTRTSYTLVWEDGVYSYCLRGTFRSTEELLAIAHSVPFFEKK